MGFLCGGNVNNFAAIFPKPILGVILVFEGLSLLNLVKYIVPVKNDFVIMLLVALVAICLPYGYLIGMIVGTAMYHLYHERAIGIPESVHIQKLINK